MPWSKRARTDSNRPYRTARCKAVSPESPPRLQPKTLGIIESKRALAQTGITVPNSNTKKSWFIVDEPASPIVLMASALASSGYQLKRPNMPSWREKGYVSIVQISATHMIQQPSTSILNFDCLYLSKHRANHEALECFRSGLHTPRGALLDGRWF